MIDLINNKKTKKELKKTKKTAWYKKKWVIFLAGFLLIVIILGVYSYQPAKRAYQYAMLGKDKIFTAQDFLAEQEIEKAAEQIEAGLSDLEAADQSFVRIKWLKFFPILGRQVRATEKLLNAAIALAESADQLAGLGLEIYTLAKNGEEVNFAEVSVEEKEQILQKISDAKPLLVASKENVDYAAQEIKKIPRLGLLPQISGAADLFEEKVQPLQNIFDQTLPLVDVLPSIFGYPESKTYLFLLQNNTELRPTGGFIGTYGIVTLEAAEIETFWTDNIYNLDDNIKDQLIIEPPWQLERYLNASQWYMRDSNWSPDFPTAAEKAMWFYQQEGGTEKLDGVIAVTPTFIESLIEIVGNITVHGIEFDKDNFVDVLQYQVEKGYYQKGISESERKEVIGDMSKVLMDKILALPQDKYDDLWQTFSQDVKQKHILLYFNDQQTQQIINEQNWSGEILTANGDYLFVVDSNLASLKSDPAVQRTINYQLEKTDKGYQATAEIEYDHTGQFDWKTTRYRTYTRVYVPPGSQLISSQGSMADDRSNQPGEIEEGEELGKTYFGAFIAIEPETTGTLSFTYQLPDYIEEQIANGKYTLAAQKQAGTIGHQLKVNLGFEKKVKSWHPLDKGRKDDNNRITFETDLSEDRNFAINF